MSAGRTPLGRQAAACGAVGRTSYITQDDDASCADAVASLLERDVTGRRLLARQQAERYGWPAAVRGFLDAHGHGVSRP